MGPLEPRHKLLAIRSLFANRSRAVRHPRPRFSPAVSYLEERTLLAANIWASSTTGGDWDVASNWSLNRVPIATDDVTIGTAGLQITHTGTNAETIHSLTNAAVLNFSAGSLTVGYNSSITGSATFGPSTALTLKNLALSGVGSLTTQGTSLFLNTTISAPLTNSGSLTINNVNLASTTTNQGTITALYNDSIKAAFTNTAGSNLILQADDSQNGTGGANLTVTTNITNSGTITLTGIGNFYGTNNGVQINQTSGALTNTATGSIISLAGSNGGSRTISVTTMTTSTGVVLQGTFNNQGTTSAQTNVLTINQDGPSPKITNTGTISAAANQSVTINNGALNMSGGVLSGAGAVALNYVAVAFGATQPAGAVGGAAVTLSNSTVSGPGAVNVAPGGGLTLYSDTVNTALSNKGTVVATYSNTINGAVTNAAGATLLVQADDTLNGVGSADLTLNAGLNNAGAVTLTGIGTYYGTNNSATLDINSGTLTNQAGGIITAAAGADGGARTININSAYGGNQPVAATLNNRGTIAATGNSLSVNEGGPIPAFVNPGTVTVGAGQALTVNYGFVFMNGGKITGAGSLNLNSLTATLTFGQPTGALGISSVNLGSSTVNGPGTLTVAQGTTLTLFNDTINAPLTNQGAVVATNDNTLNGAATNAAGATLTIQADDRSTGTGPATLTANGGLTNAGAVVLTGIGNGDNAAYGYNNVTLNVGGTLTNQAGGTITAAPGTDGGGRTINYGTVYNQGALVVNQSLGLGNAILNNTGAVSLSGGDLSITSGTLTNSGAVAVPAGRTLSLSSSNLTASAGSVGGAGTLSADSSTLNLGAAGLGVGAPGGSPQWFGAVNLSNSTVNGPGTLTVAQGSTLTLYNDTLNAPLTNQGAVVATNNNTLNGAATNAAGATLTIRADDSSTGTGPATLTANGGWTNAGSIVLTNIGNGYYASYGYNAATLDLRGKTLTNTPTGSIFAAAGTNGGGRWIYGTIYSQGAIGVDGPTASGPTTLSIAGSVDVSGSAFFNGSAAGIVAIIGSLSGATQNATQYGSGPVISAVGEGTTTIEVMSQDLGNTSAGFLNNFAYNRLTVAANTTLQLVDYTPNTSSSPGTEALYVNTLVVPAGASLNLNGYHIYARSTSIAAGSVYGGTVTTLAPGGPLATNTPIPGKVATSGASNTWTFSGTAGDVVSLAVLTPTGTAPRPLSPAIGFAQVTLNSPSGTLLGNASTGTSSSGAFLNLGPITLSATGTYTVVVAAPSGSAATGNYVLTVNDTPANTPAVGTATAVVSSVNPSVYGAPITFSANVTATRVGTATPTGTIQFAVGGHNLGGPITLVNGRATSPAISTLAVGNFAVTATYVPASGAFAGSSGTLNIGQTVTPDSTSVRVSSPTVAPVFGQPVTFTAAVTTVPPGAGTPTGTVTFYDGATTLGTGLLNASGVATFTTTAPLSAGTHSITATYGGDANDLASTGALPGGGTVNQASTSAMVSMTSPTTAPVYGQPVTFTAVVTTVSPGAGTPTGTVAFYDGVVLIGLGTLDQTGTASLTLSTPLPTGLNAIIATYGGDANFIGSNATVAGGVTVAPASTSTGVSVVAPTGTPVFGQAVTFSATVTAASPGAGTPTGTVTFYDGATPLGASVLNASGVTTFTITAPLSAGTHSITATYGGDVNDLASTSAASGLTVAQASTSASVAVTSPSGQPVFGQSVTFAATVAAVSPGAGTPTGTVTFSIGATTLGTGTLNASGIATFTTTTPLPVGDNLISVSYAGDANFVSSGGALPGTLTVVPRASVTAVATSSSSVVYSAPATFTATVTGSGGVPVTGSVKFYDGTTLLTTVALNGGTAAYTTSSLAVGSHPITADYVSDTGYQISNSSPLQQTVKSESTTSSVTSSANPAAPSVASVTWTATVKAVAPGTYVPTGTVQFVVNGLAFGSPVTLVNGVATSAVYPNPGSGNYTVTSAFTPANNNTLTSTGTLSGGQTFQVVTATSLAASPAYYGQTMVLTATVLNSTTSSVPTGGVTFYVDGKALATVTLTNGSATYNLNTTTVTPNVAHSFTATYIGATAFAASTAPAVSQTVSPAATTTSLTSSAATTNYGDSLTFTATVANTSSSVVPSGTVSFYLNYTGPGTGTLLKTVALSSTGVATLTTTTVPAGSSSVTAVYNPPTNNAFVTSTSASVTQTVGQDATTTSLTSPAATSYYGQTVTLTAKVNNTTNTTVPSGTVNFYLNYTGPGTGTLLKAVALSSTGVATLSTTALPLGISIVTAVYNDSPTNGNFLGSSSSAVTQTVRQAATSTAFTSPSAGGSAAFGSVVTFSVKVSDLSAASFLLNEGTVDILDTFNGTTTVIAMAVQVVNGVATFSTSSLAIGTHSFTAKFKGSQNLLASSSSPLSFTITP